jgi:hypothetical protein
MWDFNLGRAISMVLRTLPFVLSSHFRELAGKAASWIPKPTPQDAANPAAAPKAV